LAPPPMTVSIKYVIEATVNIEIGIITKRIKRIEIEREREGEREMTPH
jgi:hypothetical protein